MVESVATGVSIKPFPKFRRREEANSTPSGDFRASDFRANLDNFGRINIVVNHVGIVETGKVVEATGASWARHLGQAIWDCVFAVNLRSAFVTTKQSIPAMIAGEDGSIVNIVSPANIRTGMPYCSYPGSKAALNQLTR
jgi:NAD(P)-dependent dehydrogenase (short-subunit alcohol dehydrogenase family)